MLQLALILPKKTNFVHNLLWSQGTKPMKRNDDLALVYIRGLGVHKGRIDELHSNTKAKSGKIYQNLLWKIVFYRRFESSESGDEQR